jgi:predicted enzyme related to lactoylglutathione lyase
MVSGCEEACDRAVALGGTVARKPVPVATGWYARVADPHAAQFAVMELEPALRAALGA